MSDPSLQQLIDQALNGSRRATARLMTRVERSREGAEAVVRAIYPHTGAAQIIGITGSPGSGKSTLVNELAKAFRCLTLESGKHPEVGIVAVDPSSPFTGGALMGDRVRMRDLSGDEGIFIRSMASRGRLGGLAQATADVVKVLDAVGFDIILIETVGAGQAEVDIANTAPTTIVIEAPGMGDDIQSIKAGILEIADILVVNKADLPNAKRTVQSLRQMQHLNPFGTRNSAAGELENGHEADEKRWRTPLQETVATSGEGVDKLVDSIMKHRTYLLESGELARREQARSRHEIEQLLYHRLMRDLMEKVPAQERSQLIAEVASRSRDPYQAVNKLYQQLAES